MTEIELLDTIKKCCFKNKTQSILVADYIEHFDTLSELELRGCISITYLRDKAKITFIKDMPDNPVGIINENDPQTKRIIEMLKQGILRKHIAKEVKVSMTRIADCMKYITQKNIKEV